MVERRLAEAVEMMQGTLISGDPERTFRGAALDSRRLTGGELFFALRGERTDGHRFVSAALEAGAAAAVVAPAAELGTWSGQGAVIMVEEPLAALHALTRALRQQVPRHLVGITGSAGKTTTKELLAAMLGRRFRTARSPGNLNNLYGFPLALLGIAEDTEWMVAELGMSKPGELAEISALARPDVAVFTNVRAAHLEFFGSLRAIAEGKAGLLAGLATDGLVVANADDPEVRGIVERHASEVVRDGRCVWYGHGEGVAVRAREVAPRQATTGSRFVLEAGGRRQDVELPLHGRYNVDNCLAAAACAWRLGLELEEIALAVQGVQSATGRGIVLSLEGGVVVIDDTYNSNPDAVDQALASAATLPAERRWAVLGDMLELGPEAPRYHRAAGASAAVLGFEPVVGVGELSRELVLEARRQGVEAHWFADAAAAGRWLPAQLREGDLLLVKGSRGVGLDAVVSAIRGSQTSRSVKSS